VIEERLPLSLPPGYFKNGTPYQAQNRWTDGNLVRFLDGTIRAVGGWRRMAACTFRAPIRASTTRR
jgi:hypothetical protein